MDNTIEINKFEKVWENFLNLFRGAMIKESRKQSLSYPLAKLLLRDALLTWTSGYGLNSSWLEHLISEFPDKGELVKEIITKDIKLVELPISSNHENTIKTLVPICVGGVGYTVSSLMGLGMFGVATSTILPAAIAIPLTKSQISNAKGKNIEKTIEQYVIQLEKYKKSIESVLLAE